MRKISLLLVLCTISFIGNAQKLSHLDGTYVGKYSEYSFEDKLIFEGDRLTEVMNLGWHYGIDHTYVYSITFLENDLVNLTQIKHFREGKRNRELGETGRLHNLSVRIVKLDDGNISLIHPSQEKDSIEFQLVQKLL